MSCTSNKVMSSNNNMAPSTTRSLKAIIKNRQPLSKYINNNYQHKKQYQPKSYFQKLKHMVTNNNIPTSIQQQLTEVNNKQSFQYHQNNQLYTQQNYQNKQKRTFSKNNQKQRSQSYNRLDYSHLHHHKIYQNNQNNIYQKTIQKAPSNISQIKSQIISKMSPLQSIHTKKQMKKQTLYYKKFKQLLSNHPSFDKIQLTNLLGSGSNASVRLAKNKQFDKLAIKIYQKYSLIQESKKKRVYKQIYLLGKLSHKNIIQLIQAYQDKRQIHLIFQCIDSSLTLQDYFRKQLLNLSQRELKRIIKQIIQGVIYLHSKGVAHRDLKPDNILVSDSEVKIIDFGFATTNNEGQIQCGTPNFMAPQLYGKKKTYYPLKVDIWALGVLMFYLSQSCYPFKGYNQKDLIRNINSGQFQMKRCPLGLRQIIKGCLVLDPENRINSWELLQYSWFQCQ